MRGKGNNNRHRIGCLVSLMGVLVFMGIILPPGFWWFVLGAVLICSGFWVMRGC